MSTDNTILHRRAFERLIEAGDAEDGRGEEIASAILFAALAVAKNRLGTNRTWREAREFISPPGQDG